ncbi:MAG: response regulator [Deltaproteobacteria bacterium]|nr:response regulator [Deltaproteobacteria bacterium]
MPAERQKIGEILVAKRIVDAGLVASTLKQQPGSDQRLCSLLYLHQMASEEALVRALAAQLGLPGVALTRSVVDLSVLELIPQTIAERYSLMPIARDGDRLSLAMADPLRREVIDEVQFVTGTHAVALVALKGMIDASLRSVYAAFAQGRRDLLHGPQADRSQTRGLVATVYDEPAASAAPARLTSDEEFFSVADFDDDFFEAKPEQPPEPPVELEELPALEPVAEEAAVAPPTGRARILVVDDEADIRNLLATVLGKAGYAVLFAERGLQALELIKTQTPDLVLLDAMLPEIHGFEICKKIKSSKNYRDLPVIMVTAIYRGWRFAQDVRATYGADDFVEKPFSVADLLHRVEEQLVRARKIERTPRPHEKEIEELRQRGSQAHKEGDHERALECFRLAIEMEPFDSRLHFSLAMSLQAIGESYSAIYEFERAVELDPQLFPALKNLAVLYERKGFRNKSAEQWERALRHAPRPEIKDEIKAHLMNLLES